MEQLTIDVLRRLIDAKGPPCISLYQPAHRALPDLLQDPIRYRNLVREAERSLLEIHPKRDAHALLEPFRALGDNNTFWAHQRSGLAVLGSADAFEVFRLQRPVKELVIVADSFHLKPLLRIVQSADRYQVLCLDRHEARLLEGNRDALDEVDLGDMPATITAALGAELTDPQRKLVYGGEGGEGTVFFGKGDKNDEARKDLERFFRFIDREILDRFSRPSGLPLVLAALPEHHAEFHQISHNPFLQAEGVHKHPGSLSIEELQGEVWRVVEPKYLARLAQLIDDHRTAAARGLAASDPGDVGRAAVARRIGTLLIEADRELPGWLDPATGAVHPEQLSNPVIDDLIDDLAEMVLQMSGEVVVVPSSRMPTATGLAATFRH